MPADEPLIVRVTHKYEASAERVFDAWLAPEMIGRWMFGPALRDETVLHLEVDARVGGRFSFLVRRGSDEIDHVGTYRELDRPRTLVFTWGIAGESVEESVVTIEIVPRDGGCALTLTHQMDPKWQDYAERTQAGWTKMVTSLEASLTQDAR